MNLALFDFDGTIIDRDSLVEFITFNNGRARFYKGLLCLSPVLMLYLFGLWPNWKAKEALIKFFFKGWELDTFKKQAARFLQRIDAMVRPEAAERIQWHKENGDVIVVVSASPELWIRDWCEKNGLDLLGTRLEISDGTITGRFDGKNCFGEEKVRRITEKYRLDEYEKIFAYGDSNGDTQMLELADVRYYKWRMI